MQTAGLFLELPRPSWEGVGRRREERRREEKRGEERRREERGEEGVGRGFQEGTGSWQHAACPGAQASPPASNDALSPKNTQDAPRRVPRTQVANPEKSSRLRSVCNKRRAPSFTLQYPSFPNLPWQTPRYSRTHSRTYPADLPTSLSPYAATPAHYPSPAARA